MPVCIALAAALTLGFAAGGRVQAADQLTPISSGDELGLVRVRCVTDSNFEILFRAALVQVEQLSVEHEIVLTAGHGLPRNVDTLRSQCVLIDAAGRDYRLHGAWRSDQHIRGLANDWAVLTTQRRLRRNQPRLLVAAPSVEERRRMESAESSLRLPLLTVAEERACALEQSGISADERARGLFSHTCRSWHGHSGSPILALRGDAVVLIGIHLASRWFYEGQRSIKIGRYVDTAIMDAIYAAAGREPVSVDSEAVEKTDAAPAL